MSGAGRMRPRRVGVIGAGALLALGLTGCASIGEAVSDATGQAACAVVTPIATDVGAQVQVVADQIELDPSGAITTLTALQERVDGAADVTSGDIASALGTVSSKVGELIAQAEQVRDGGVVDQATVDGIETSIVDGLTSLAGDCEGDGAQPSSTP